MQLLQRFYREVWAVDFEFYAPPGERPTPLCLVARELHTGRLVTSWLEGTRSVLPLIPSGKDVLMIAYYASAELACFLALAWPFPMRVLDLYAEFRCLTSGRPVPCGYGLLGALTAFGIEGMAAVEKD